MPASVGPEPGQDLDLVGGQVLGPLCRHVLLLDERRRRRLAVDVWTLDGAQPPTPTLPVLGMGVAYRPRALLRRSARAPGRYRHVKRLGGDTP